MKNFKITSEEFAALYYLLLTAKSLIKNKESEFQKDYFIRELETAINDYDMTAEEFRIKYYGDNDSRSYDEDELKLMIGFAEAYHKAEVEAISDEEICEWIWDNEFYDTSCNNGFQFMNDGIKENNFKYCPYCGGKIAETNY